ncbi:unnamed protein product [Parascedosporium putredinis]|uniref:Glycosyltransferase family 32 protein n=1 Tax=Parascedosporium putredinis TaxID=1442378 RepID=A0A9P1GXY4_9PEZI|nr:unnamed protein product [Parascedosporium putredinis]CAI7990250.1 unnamed protein product [Parascedosporium putredinis]
MAPAPSSSNSSSTAHRDAPCSSPGCADTAAASPPWSSSRSSTTSFSRETLGVLAAGQAPAAQSDAPRDLDPHPHFLYHSSFRANPDLEYETRLDDALLELERRVTREESRDVADKTLWQIMLGPAERGPTLMPLSAGIAAGNTSFSPLRSLCLLPSAEAQANHSPLVPQAVRDDWANTFINTTFFDIPDLARLYHEYPHDVLRADLLRYLILWFYGGYYADTDIKPARAIDECPLGPRPPRNAAEADAALADTALDVSLVVGIEIDEPWASARLMRRWHWIRTYGFIQYNLYAPQRFSPILRRAIVRALAHTRRHHAAYAWWPSPPLRRAHHSRNLRAWRLHRRHPRRPLRDPRPRPPSRARLLAADANAGELALLETAARQAKIPRVTWAPFIS